MKRFFHFLVGVMVLVVCVALAPAAGNAVDTLTSGNSTVSINPTSQAGVYSWVVDGKSQLYQQWWWVGQGTGANAGQSSIDTLTLSNSSIGTSSAIYNYTGAAYNVDTTYILLGGTAGSGASDVGEQFRLTNTSGSTQTYRIYLYADFDLGGTVNDTSCTMLADLHKVTQVDSSTSSQAATINVPDATYGEVNFYANTLNSLNSGVTYTLNDNLSLGSGDLTWALEWVVTVGAGGSEILSIDKNITVPVPPSLVLLGSGLLGLVGLRFRRSRA